MKTYQPNEIQGNLTELPPLADDKNYIVNRGNPIASIRIDSGTLTSKCRSGVWRCTPGVFTCIEKGDELQTLLKGKLRLTEKNGETQEFSPGDCVVTRKGTTVTWEIIETVEKVFFTYDYDGS